MGRQRFNPDGQFAVRSPHFNNVAGPGQVIASELSGLRCAGPLNSEDDYHARALAID